VQATVIVPNLNGEKYLDACLSSLHLQSRPAAQVIVVDNGSADRSREIVAAHPLRPELIALPRNLGFAAAVNRGIAAAAHDAVALLNNDAEADPGWLAAGLHALEDTPAAAMIAALMLDYHDRDRVDNAGDLIGRDGRPRARARGGRGAELTGAVQVLSPCAGAAIYRRAALIALGGFAEDFWSYLEDVDLGLRALARGMRCRFVPAAVVYHHGAMTALGDRPGKKRVDSSERVYWIAKNRVRLLRRNFPAGRLALWAPALAFGLARSLIYHQLISGQGNSFRRGLSAGLGCWAEDGSFQAAGAAAMKAPLWPWIGVEARPWTP
jgi:GT2 family glycosyltransferase